MNSVKILLLLSLLFLSACYQTAEVDKEECHEGIIDENGRCIPAKTNNVELFGQDLDMYVDSEYVEEGALGFLAQPKEKGNYPGVVMIHEWWGLNDNIKEMAKLLAKEGYIVFAVDLFEGEVADESGKARELSGAVRDNPDKAIQGMKDAAAYLKNVQEVEKLASFGWCFGGGQSLQLSLNEVLDATVIYYGSLTDDKDQLQNIDWPVLGIFGEEDGGIPVDSVRSFQSALNELEVDNEIYIYPGLGHAFASPSGSNYAPEETVDAWEKTVKFLDASLK